MFFVPSSCCCSLLMNCITQSLSRMSLPTQSSRSLFYLFFDLYILWNEPTKRSLNWTSTLPIRCNMTLCFVNWFEIKPFSCQQASLPKRLVEQQHPRQVWSERPSLGNPKKWSDATGHESACWLKGWTIFVFIKGRRFSFGANHYPIRTVFWRIKFRTFRLRELEMVTELAPTFFQQSSSKPVN